MTIRKYHPGEEAEIWQIYYHTTRQIIGQNYTQKQVQHWAPDQIEPNWNDRLAKKNPFVAVHEDQIVGFAELETDGHIDRFYCHHLWQRRGVGKMLYNAIEDEALSLKMNSLFLESSLTACQFFESRGFIVVKEEANLVCGAPAPRFHMRKELV